MTRRLPLLLAGAVAAATALAGCGLGSDPETRTFAAEFERTVGVYVHSDVRVLGVRIGEVTRIEPRGDKVRVEMEYDAKHKVPADAQAVVIAPSIVSDRYVQLTPVWRSGPTLADGAKIPVERTAVPVELDEIYAALDELNVALGPKGANRNGALSDLLDTGARNLEGNGELLGQTLEDLSQAVETLSDQRQDLFGTVRNLQDFTTTLARSDQVVRRFNSDLAAVAEQLAGERQDLATATRQLSLALGEVATFVRENEDDLTANVKNLADVTGTLVKQKRALEEFLDNSATALSNLQLAYNPDSGTLDTRDNNESQATPQSIICDLLVTVGQPQSLCAQFKQSMAQQQQQAPVVPTRDMTLGGILGAGR